MDYSYLPDNESKETYFRVVPTTDLRPNPWNPNRIPPDIYQKLKKAVAERGLLSPILVRPASEGNEKFEIIDGEHRFQIARSLNIEEIPCIVIDLSNTEAKIKTLQLNGLRGENEPEKLARLIKDLNLDFDVEELASLLPLDNYDIQASLDLLEIMDQHEPDSNLEEEMEQMLKETIFSTVVTREQKNLIEHAIAQSRKSKQSKEDGKGESDNFHEKPEGQILAEICEDYLSRPR